MNAPHRPQDPSIDPDAIETFVETLFGDLAGYVAIRMLAETGTADSRPRMEFCVVNEAANRVKALAPQAARDRQGLYVVPCTVACPGRARNEDLIETRVILVDLDAGDIAAKQAHLVSHLGEPTLTVASGGVTDAGAPKLHLYWLLAEVARGDVLERVRALREVIALKVGADTSFKSLHQPIRVPGTIHGKHNRSSAVRLLVSSDAEHDLDALAAAAACMPSLPGMPPHIDTGTRSTGSSARDLLTRKIRADNADGTSRFEALSKVMGHWIRLVRLGHWSLAEAWTAAQDYNAAQIDPPWDEARLRREFDALLKRDRAAHTWRDVSGGSEAGAGTRSSEKSAGDGTPGADATSGPSSASTPAPALSEDALAAAFVKAHGADWRHVAAWGAWFQWDGTRWRRDDLNQVRELLRQTCRSAANGGCNERDARRLASAKTITAAERIAAPDPLIATGSDRFDAHPALLNTPAGTIDLASGEVQPHDRRHLLTQVAAASPGTGCPRWLRFLDEVTGGDSALQAYLQRLCGYCLTGDTSSQMLAFLHGQGANGKSVFLSILRSVLGDYAATATLDTFVQTRGSRHLTELAGLRAARVVIVPETEAGAAWAESRIKLVTGGEKVRANFMHKDHFEFTPQFKLLVAGNHRPTLTSISEAMRRRLHLVPFSVTIPSERRDPQLTDKLLEERNGILGWMLEGCAEWQRSGLAPPASITAAADEYFSSEDLVGQWIEEACEVGPEQRATARALFESWSAFADSAGEPSGTQKSLGGELRARGFKPGKVLGLRGWHGLALRKGARGGEGAE